MSINPKKVKKLAGAGVRSVGEIIRTILRIVGTVLLIVITTGTLFACLFANYVKTTVSDDLDIELYDFAPDLTSVIYAVDPSTGGYVELASLSGGEDRIWVSYDQIPKSMEQAAVAIEDKRFYEHQGVDWYRTLGAVGNMFFGMKDTFGASTITQQLVKNWTQEKDVTVQRKLLEIFRALRMEQNYDKEIIMEWYLNLIYLGEGCYGVQAAALEYFGKNVWELSTAECACLIGITNNPSLYSPYADREANKERQEIILTQMYEQGFIETEAEYKAAMKEHLIFQRAEDEAADTQIYSWFVEAVIEDVIADLMEEYDISYDMAERYLYSGGYKVYTTMDMNIQAKVDSIYQNMEEIPAPSVQSETQYLRSSIVITDPYTGNVVALAGDVGEKSGNRIFNYATQMRRSPGSTIKPIAVYAPGIEYGHITPATVFNDDGEIRLEGNPSWFPNNDTYSYSGNIAVTEAVRRSVNTVAAQVMDLVRPENAYDFLTSKLGFYNLVEDDMNYASMSLGELTHGVSVREMSSAYTCFVNGGTWTESRTYTHITDDNGNIIFENIPESTTALSEKSAYYMTNLMQGVVTGGTGYAARVDNMPTAGKTGASTAWRDRWFVGCTPYYVAAVWSGYEIPETMGSANPAAQLFRKVMNLVHEDLEYREFAVPDGSRSYYSICKDCGGTATEACDLDVRGKRSESIVLFAEDAPSSRCTCHVILEICEDTGKLATPDCPEDQVKRIAVLDDKNPDLPEVVNITRPYKNEETGEPIKYLLSEYGEELCDGDHVKGFWEEWAIDPATQMYIDPVNGWLYNPDTERYYDKATMWEVDPLTGYLWSPQLNVWVDPVTLQPPVADPSVPPTTDPTTPPTTDPTTPPTTDPVTPPIPDPVIVDPLIPAA